WGQTHEQNLSKLGLPFPANTVACNSQSTAAPLTSCTAGAGITISGGSISSSGGGGGASNFGQLASGTNTSAAMLVGTGSSLGVTGSGTISATTSAALAATPTQCTGGQYATGVTAAGNANCGTPTGSGTVNSGTAGQVAYYATSTTAVSGMSVGSNTFVGNNGSGLAALSAAQAQGVMIAQNAQTYTPTLASGATSDWDPTAGSITTAGFVYATPNAAGSTVNGIVAGSEKQQFKLCNAAALGSDAAWIILENQSSSDTTAANRLMGSGNNVLGPQQCTLLTYLGGSINRWQVGRVDDAGTPAFEPLSTASSMTPDCSFKRVRETASQVAFTFNAPTDCTPRNGQLLELDLTSYSTASTFTFNGTYHAGSSVSLPSGSATANKMDRLLFQYNSTLSDWDLLSVAQGF
ncbi:MAG: hypothetical protein KGL39_45905, partial [Patescibacteria group bacterium]|nr:hypothetical protein [Patescibacteria group bacterium]